MESTLHPPPFRLCRLQIAADHLATGESSRTISQILAQLPFFQSYDIYWQVNLQANTFNGSVNISVYANQSTSLLVLQTKELTVSSQSRTLIFTS